MTTNQLIAMGFPLLAAAAVGLTAVFVRKPWAEEPATNGEIVADGVMVKTEDAEIREVKRGTVIMERSTLELNPSGGAIETVAVQERRSDMVRTPREAIVAAKTLLDQALRELPPEPPMPGAPQRPSH
jgi:hypothetical protein